MKAIEQVVDQHYGRGGILDAILDALKNQGKDIQHLKLEDLAPVDEFHIRGREATLELATLARLSPDLPVLDVGCGLGGSVRHLATEHKCRVEGLDLTREYIETATALSKMVGVGDRVIFHHGSALDMPFENDRFDVVWTEHAQMNITDKDTFYNEIVRVLKPGGRLVFHDIFQGNGGPIHYPVPWAEESHFSALVSPDELEHILVQANLEIINWEDKTQASLAFFDGAIERLKSSGPPPLGIHLLMGNTAKTKFEHMRLNLQENRIAVLQAVLEKKS